MKVSKFCKNCGARIKAGREDRVFCSDKCGAAYHRGGTPDHAHEEKIPGVDHQQKARTNKAKCQYCGEEFIYNDYAERGGERVPRYHSNVCRQAAYRARKAGRNTPYEDMQYQEAQKKAGQTDSQKRAWDNFKKAYDGGAFGGDANQGETRKTSKNTWEDVLGVPYGASWDIIQAAWKRLIGECHPDRNRDRLEWAIQRTQDINQAYQALQKQHGKKTRQTRP